MGIIEKVKELNGQIAELKEEFAQYIKDKNIPLDVRWQLFLDAPANLRETSCYIERYEGLPEGMIGYDGPIWAERHQQVEVDYILEVLENPEDYDFDASKVDIVAFKEDVLSRNLYSFTYDW